MGPQLGKCQDVATEAAVSKSNLGSKFSRCRSHLWFLVSLFFLVDLWLWCPFCLYIAIYIHTYITLLYNTVHYITFTITFTCYICNCNYVYILHLDLHLHVHICIWIWIYNTLHHSTVQHGTVHYIICTICIHCNFQLYMIWMWYHSILSAPSHLGISKELPPSGCLGDCGADRRQRLATPKRVAGGMRVALMESGTKWVSQEDFFLPNLELSDLQSEVSRNCTRHWIIINPDGYSVSQPKVSSCYGDCKLLNMHRLRPSHNNFVSFWSKGRPVQPSVCREMPKGRNWVWSEAAPDHFVSWLAVAMVDHVGFSNLDPRRISHHFRSGCRNYPKP